MKVVYVIRNTNEKKNTHVDRIMIRISPVLLLLFLLISLSCNTSDKKDNQSQNESGSAVVSQNNLLDTADYEWQKYTNAKYHFSFEYPDNWKVYDNTKEDKYPVVINVYNFTFQRNIELPLRVHEDPKLSYLSFFPEGFGVDGPSGDRIKLEEAGTNAPLSFDVDQQKSVAYQLNDGQVWGYLIKPVSSPPGWKSDGFIFVQIGVKGHYTKCFDAEGKEKPVANCNVMGGKDRLIRYGEVKKDQRQQVDRILSSLHFFNGKKERPVEDLIKVEHLSANADVTSPVKIEGKARGMWFFEGEFPVMLLDSNNKILARTSVQAKDNWMTESWVPFEAKLRFDVTESQPATLVFKRANASGKPEHDRSIRIPLLLSPND